MRVSEILGEMFLFRDEIVFNSNYNFKYFIISFNIDARF